LPLTSLESPLPAFSLGQVAYFNDGIEPERTNTPLVSWRDVISRVFSSKAAFHIDRIKTLEFLLRAVLRNEAGQMAQEFAVRYRDDAHRALVGINAREPEAPDAHTAHLKAVASDPLLVGRRKLPELLYRVFNDAALTPYTNLVDQALSFVEGMESQGHLLASDVASFFARLLWQLGRHLTAYDLVTFHHRGANYPDALVLDEMLKAYLRLIEREPSALLASPEEHDTTQRTKRLRRRGLRQAWLMRRRYEGHLVPDAPTSPGENLRVLPPPHPRVPEEQITNSSCRTKRLYWNDPLDNHLGKHAREALRQSFGDLLHPDELRELGMAIFLDRPLSADKGPTEQDDTLLFSYLAFSRAIASERLTNSFDEMKRFTLSMTEAELRVRLAHLEVKGLSIRKHVDCSRPAIVSLADALRTAEDFVLFSTTYHSWFPFARKYLWQPSLEVFALKGLPLTNPELLVRCPRSQEGLPRLMMYDSEMRPRMELTFDPTQGYVSRKGVEYPASPLRLLRVWEQTEDGKPLRERDLSGEMVLLDPPIV
jgi:hypothetical protein